MEMLLDGNTDEYTVDWQKIPTFYKENLLTIFLQSPVWAPLKSRLKMMNPRSAFAWVQRRIVKHFPAILVTHPPFSPSAIGCGRSTHFC